MGQDYPIENVELLLNLLSPIALFEFWALLADAVILGFSGLKLYPGFEIYFAGVRG